MHIKDAQRLDYSHSDLCTPRAFVRKPAAGVACTALEFQRCVIKGGGWACISTFWLEDVIGIRAMHQRIWSDRCRERAHLRIAEAHLDRQAPSRSSFTRSQSAFTSTGDEREHS